MKLQIRGVSKSYKGNHWALRDFTLNVGPGLLGLLGPNGAGKTTLMRILATVILPTEGTVTWNNTDITKHPDALRRVLGYLPQAFGVYDHLNAFEFMDYLAHVRGLRTRPARHRIEYLLETAGLHSVQNMPLGEFSGGMKQRLGIAQALLNDPQVLIVDEPTAGLDPGERVRFRNLLAELAGERIVILSTHIVSDVEAAASAIALIHNGRLLRYGAPESLLAESTGKVWELVVPSSEMSALKARFQISSSIHRTDGVHVRIISQEIPAPEASTVAPSLEDAYLYHLSLTGLIGASEII
jgi:ABC-type multidrug transport system ATPase subunit